MLHVYVLKYSPHTVSLLAAYLVINIYQDLCVDSILGVSIFMIHSSAEK
jgi:hypothetical protein